MGLCLAAIEAEGKILDLPGRKPVMKVQSPKGWSVEEIERGYSLESPDKEVTVMVELTPREKLKALVKENNDWLLKDNKIVFDQKSMKDEVLTIGETEWKRSTWKVTQEDWGAGHVMVGLVEASPTQVLLVTAWTTLKGEKKYGQELEDIYGSVMQAGQPTVDMEKMEKEDAKPGTLKGMVGAIATEQEVKPKAANETAPEKTGTSGGAVDPSLLIGMWLGDKYISFYEDGRYGLQKYEGAPVDDKDRTWKLKGNRITWNALGDVFTETIVTLTRKKLVIKDAEGNLQTYTRVGD
ncbi:hypothetical protein BH09VER1_BH09VER1_27200 [soil metagenome]